MSANGNHPKNVAPVILIVAEDSALRQALSDIFEFSGYATVTARSACEGLKTLGSIATSVDLIISDLLEGSDLFYHAVHIENPWREIPFIFLTSQNRRQWSAETRTNRPPRSIHLSKPFPVEDLLSSVDQFVYGPRNGQGRPSFTESA